MWDNGNNARETGQVSSIIQMAVFMKGIGVTITHLDLEEWYILTGSIMLESGSKENSMVKEN